MEEKVKMINTYHQLDYQTKKERLSQLLWEFVWISEKIHILLWHVNADRLTEQDMVAVYDVFIDNIFEVNKEKKLQSLDKIDSVISKINAIHEQESLDRAKENPDAILSALDDI